MDIKPSDKHYRTNRIDLRDAPIFNEVQPSEHKLDLRETEKQKLWAKRREAVLQARRASFFEAIPVNTDILKLAPTASAEPTRWNDIKKALHHWQRQTIGRLVPAMLAAIVLATVLAYENAQAPAARAPRSSHSATSPTSRQSTRTAAVSPSTPATASTTGRASAGQQISGTTGATGQPSGSASRNGITSSAPTPGRGSSGGSSNTAANSAPASPTPASPSSGLDPSVTGQLNLPAPLPNIQAQSITKL